MPATERNDRFRTAVLISAPLRFLIAATTVLVLATLLVSSAAHGLALGEASAQSALGSPLRIVIPITAGPDEALQADCFRFVPLGGDGSASIVTAHVSLERAAAASRLVVTTAKSVNEPAIRFGIQAECDGLAQRAYVVLLDPPESAVSGAATAQQASAREPRQERIAPSPAAVRRNPGVTAPAPMQVVHVPNTAERPVPAPVIAAEPLPREHVANAGGGMVGSSPYRQVAATPVLPPSITLPARVRPVAASGGILGYLLAAGFAIVGALALAVLFARRRQAPPAIPQWTRNPSFSDTRSSFTDLAAAPVTLPHTLPRAGTTTSQRAAASGKSKPGATSRFGEGGGLPSRQGPAPVDPSTIDTLLDATDSDLVEERAVREAWAAARSDVEHGGLDGNAILQAIEEAERDMQLAPPAPAQAAIERALEDDLLQSPRRG
jgi:predicted outer membrane lipoprotein